jgi:hypothetical protein
VKERGKKEAQERMKSTFLNNEIIQTPAGELHDRGRLKTTKDHNEPSSTFDLMF